MSLGRLSESLQGGGDVLGCFLLLVPPTACDELDVGRCSTSGEAEADASSGLLPGAAACRDAVCCWDTTVWRWTTAYFNEFDISVPNRFFSIVVLSSVVP